MEKLPYSNGAGRRRFISGGVFFSGLLFFFWDYVSGLLAGMNLLDLVKSPVLVAGFILMVYAVGNLIEIFGDYFLVRAASGVFWSIDLLLKKTRSKKLTLTIWAIFSLPFVAAFNFTRGLVGISKYEINLKRHLSNEAFLKYEEFPEKIKNGLSNIVGNGSEVSTKYLIDLLQIDSDKKWARALINRTKDVSALTSSLFILVIVAIAVGRLPPISFSNGDTDIEYEKVIEAIQNLDINDYPTNDIKLFYANEVSYYNPSINSAWFDDVIANISQMFLDEAKKIPQNEYVSFKTKVDALVVAIKSLEKAHSDHYGIWGRLLSIVSSLGAYSPFIFLYIGYFTSLNIAIVSIVELAVLRTGEKRLELASEAGPHS
ncbi:MAG: hypothetical protein RIB71_17175 [Imperialibacter sp.]|uniref:hypothetical protein n=1 Tax=Imperialibacter sp. TaxID=2038411 RepID=UPI0032EF969D